MDTEARPSPETLLAHIGWVRALARRLVVDPDAAEDLVQDTFVAALSHPPQHRRGVATWLATTLGNARRSQQRREGARERIETLAAREERVVSTDELAARADLQRALVEHVLALEEPFRSTLLLRYFAELAPAEIAAREHVPLATVTSRLTRGLARLRELLDRRHGDRRAWLSAFAPLLSHPASLPLLPTATAGSLATLGGLLVNAKLVLAGTAVALIAIVAALKFRGADPELSTASAAPASAAAQPASTPATRGESESRSESEPPAEGRAPLAAPDSKPDSTPASPAPRAVVRVRGRLLGADGLPLAGLRVGWNAAREGLATTGSSGVFELETTAEQGTLEVAENAWITVRSGVWKAGTALEPVVIAARSLDLGGTVRDEHGNPLGGARVALLLPADFDARFSRSLEASARNAWRTLSDGEGRFSLSRTPSIDGARLGTVLEGYAASEIPEPAAADRAIAIVLARPTIPLAGALQGRVVDDLGRPVADARVFLGLASTTTDDQGRFGIPLARAVTADRITALKQGFLPAFLERPAERRDGDTGWPELVLLRLPGEALSIRGTVVDEEDRPLAGVRVWLADPTQAGAIGKLPTFAENLMAGAPVPPQALESEARAPAADGDNYNDFHMSVQPSSAFWHWVLTDEAGRFELRGLDDRRYRLRLMDPQSMFAATSEAIRAGSDGVRVPLPAADLLERLAGRVVDDAGAAVAGVTVRLTSEAVGVRSRVFGGTVYVTVRAPRERVLTDADGRFEFSGVPREGMQLVVTSEDIVPQEVDVAALASPAACTVVVHTRCSLEVLVSSTDVLADAVAVRDGEGRPIDLMVIDQGGTNAYTDVALVNGRSGIVSTSSAARTVVLLKDGVVVRTSPIRLRPGAPNLIEL